MLVSSTHRRIPYPFWRAEGWGRRPGESRDTRSRPCSRVTPGPPATRAAARGAASLSKRS